MWELLLLGCLPQQGGEQATSSPAAPGHPLLLVEIVSSIKCK